MGIATLCVGCALLVGCGQKGPLFLRPAPAATSGNLPTVAPTVSAPSQTSVTR